MKFTIYSKHGCPYCDKIKQVMNLSKFEYVAYNLGEDFTKEQFYEEFGHGSTFPQVIFNDEQHLGGCSETVKFLQESNLFSQ